MTVATRGGNRVAQVPSGDDSQMVRVQLQFSSEGLLEASSLTKVVTSLTYCYDLAAIEVGAPNYERVRPSGRQPEQDYSSSPPEVLVPDGGSHAVRPLSQSDDESREPDERLTKALDKNIPENRPRWRPRLSVREDRLRVARIEYGSPLVLDLAGDPEAWKSC